MAKSKQSTVIKVPFDFRGNLMHYSYDWQNLDKTLTENPGYGFAYEWRDNQPFQANLHLNTYQRGRSAAYFVWEETGTAKSFPMFLTDMLDMLQRATITRGIITGWWIVAKRGANYGIKLYALDNEEGSTECSTSLTL